jgi:hypothetical protein
MARTRTIWPEFFTNSDLASLSPLHRLLYAGLPTVCDWRGRSDDRPGDLKLRLLPADQADVNELMADLERIGLIERYERDGKRYFQILDDWRKQHPHVEEKKQPTKPPTPRGRPDVNTGHAPGINADLLSLASDPLSLVSDHKKPLPAPPPSPSPSRAAAGSDQRSPTPAQADERLQVREYWDAGFRKRSSLEPLKWGVDGGRRHSLVIQLLKLCGGVDGAKDHLDRYFARYDSDVFHRGNGLKFEAACSTGCIEELRSAKPRRRANGIVTASTSKEFEAEAAAASKRP